MISSGTVRDRSTSGFAAVTAETHTTTARAKANSKLLKLDINQRIGDNKKLALLSALFY
jgi:hypothetical protein